MFKTNLFSGHVYNEMGSTMMSESGLVANKFGNDWLTKNGNLVQKQGEDWVNMTTGVRSSFGDPFEEDEE